MEYLYLVFNDHQGLHFIASNRTWADWYITNKCKLGSGTGVWQPQYFHVVEQPLNRPITDEVSAYLSE
jgi:hypothetical protein